MTEGFSFDAGFAAGVASSSMRGGGIFFDSFPFDEVVEETADEATGAVEVIVEVECAVDEIDDVEEDEE